MIIKFKDYEKVHDQIQNEGIESVKENISESDYKTLKRLDEFDPMSAVVVFSLLGGEGLIAGLATLFGASKVIDWLDKNIEKLNPWKIKRYRDGNKLVAEYAELQSNQELEKSEITEKVRDVIEDLEKEKGRLDPETRRKREEGIELRRKIDKKWQRKEEEWNEKHKELMGKYPEDETFHKYIDHKIKIIQHQYFTDEKIGEDIKAFFGEDSEEYKEWQERGETLEKEIAQDEADLKNTAEEQVDKDAEAGDDRNKEEMVEPQQVWETSKGERVRIISVNPEDKTAKVELERDGKKVKGKIGISRLKNMVEEFDSSLDVDDNQETREIMASDNTEDLVSQMRNIEKALTDIEIRMKNVEMEFAQTPKRGAKTKRETLSNSLKELKADDEENSEVLKAIKIRLEDLGHKAKKPPFKIPGETEADPNAPEETPKEEKPSSPQEPSASQEWSVVDSSEAKDAAAALVKLGWRKNRAESAVRGVAEDGMSSGEIVKAAIKASK